jgi:lysophospholipase L1-like esterase
MGDSITEFGVTHPEFFLENPINRGISGQTSPQMLLRFRADVIDLKPTVVLAGGNDIAGNRAINIGNDSKQYFSMVELASIT